MKDIVNPTYLNKLFINNYTSCQKLQHVSNTKNNFYNEQKSAYIKYSPNWASIMSNSCGRVIKSINTKIILPHQSHEK